MALSRFTFSSIFCFSLFLSIVDATAAVESSDSKSNDKDKSKKVDPSVQKAVEEYFNGQFSARDISPETIDDFHEKIRRKFSILDLRPKDGEAWIFV